jgi:hypothetical protein
VVALEADFEGGHRLEQVMSNFPSLLGALLGGAGSSFLRSFRSGSVFHVEADRSSWPAFLLGSMWSDLALADPLFAGTIDVTKGGISQYRISGVPPSRCVNDLQLAVRLPELRAKIPGADAWASELERELGLAVGSAQLHAFVNPSGVGLGAHCDPCEHLLLHVAGEKRIRLAANPGGEFITASHSLSMTPRPAEYAQYCDGLPNWSALPDDAREIQLRPGSVLLLPRGVFHETLGGGAGPSATVVVQLNVPSYADLLLGYLKPYLLQSPTWRRPVHAASAPEAHSSVEAVLASLLDELGRKLPGLSPDRMLDTHASTGQPVISEATRLLRNPAVAVELDAHALRITPHGGRGTAQTFALGPDALQAVRALSQIRQPTACSDLLTQLDCWEKGSLFELLRFLLRTQVLVAVTVEEYA